MKAAIAVDWRARKVSMRSGGKKNSCGEQWRNKARCSRGNRKTHLAGASFRVNAFFVA